MSDEEMKAIESLKNIAIYMGDNYTFSQQGIRNLRENLRIVLPTIEKQSKEIEELTGNQCIYKDTSSCTKSISLKTYIALNKSDASKEESSMNYYNLYKELVDKIKAKVKEIKDRPVQDEFITATQGKLNTIIDMESLLEKE